MNMNTPEDKKWQTLLAASAPTFAAASEPPYGFVTQTLALLRNEKRESDVLERIGLRALFAALAILVAAGGLTIGLQLQDRLDFDPGVNSLLRADNVPLI